MNKKFIGILICMLLLATVLPATGLKIQVNKEKNATDLIQPAGITFYQVDYEWTKTTYLNSNTGQIVANIDDLGAATGLSSGYVNVYTSEGWVVQNLEIIEDFPYPTVGTYFDLGQTGNVETIGAYIEYTEQPLISFEYSGALPPHPVYKTAINAEGGIDYTVILRPQPPSTNHLPGYGGFDEIGANTHCTQKEHPNIQSAHMQCVPVAYANNLQYLEDWYGVYVPHDNVPGVNGTPSNSLVGQLDIKMHRDSISRYNGSGTDWTPSIKGLVEYAYFESLQIDIRHQGWEGNKDFEYEDSGYISYGQGSDIKFDFIYDEICKGSAVELAYGRFNASGGRTGGHMVMIVAAGYVYGVPYIYFLDDRNQVSEKHPTWDSIGTSGPPLRRWLIDTDNDGWYNLVEDPENDNLPPRVEAIYVQQAQNQPPLKPSTPVGGNLILEKGTIYGFTSKTTDPNGQPIWYWFDWGDGTNSGWVGPVDSGDEGGALHAWLQNGLYEIRVKAKDLFDAESEWSDVRLGVVPKTKMESKQHILLNIAPLPLNPPKLDDRTFGPLSLPGIKIIISNTGDNIERDIKWTFSVDGGILLQGREANGTILAINKNDLVEEILTPLPKTDSAGLSPLGFGKISMIVTAESSTTELIREQVDAFVIGPYILM